MVEQELPKLGTSMCDEPYAPLGQQRLYTVGLVVKIIQTNDNELAKLVYESDIFKHIFGLVRRYPWNNFLQIKVVELSEEILERCKNNELKVAFVEKSEVTKWLSDMSMYPNYIMESSNQTRNGYMGLVIAISNKLIEKADIE